jgi:hypothetical protein
VYNQYKGKRAHLPPFHTQISNTERQEKLAEYVQKEGIAYPATEDTLEKEKSVEMCYT